MDVKRVICMQCHNACRLAATVDGDRLLSVEPDETHEKERHAVHHDVARDQRR